MLTQYVVISVHVHLMTPRQIAELQLIDSPGH